jgi:hypothetical protein
MESWLSLHRVRQCAAVGAVPSAALRKYDDFKDLKFERVSALRSVTAVAKATFSDVRKAISRLRRSRYSRR